MEYVVWAVVGAGISLALFFLLTRGKAQDVERVMHQFGSQADGKGWNKPSASVWDESQSSPDGAPQEPPERS